MQSPLPSPPSPSPFWDVTVAYTNTSSLPAKLHSPTAESTSIDKQWQCANVQKGAPNKGPKLNDHIVQEGFCRQNDHHRNTDPKTEPGGKESRPGAHKGPAPTKGASVSNPLLSGSGWRCGAPGSTPNQHNR